jgi:hypothetical protein
MFVVGCAMSDEAAGGEYMDEDFPPWACETDAMSGTSEPCESSGGSAVLECVGPEDCPGEFCAASFNGDIGPFECQSQCIALLDDNRWCADAAACCDAEAICDRGYCILPEGVDGSSSETSSSSGDASTTGDSTDTSTGTDTGTGTGTSEGSTTDGA